MSYPPNVWNQLKNVSADSLIKALEKDRWERDPNSRGATIGFVKKGNPSNERVVIHYHPGKTYGPDFSRGCSTISDGLRQT